MQTQVLQQIRDIDALLEQDESGNYKYLKGADTPEVKNRIKELQTQREELSKLVSPEGSKEYEERTLRELELQKSYEDDRRRDTIRNLQERGRNIARQAGGVRHNDPISRIVYAQQDTLAMYQDQYSAVAQAMKQRASELAAAGVSEDKYAEDEDYSKLQSELAAADAGVKQFEGSAGLARTAVMQIGEAVTNVAGQFARQLFHQAIQEAKRFVVEYDKAMTEIQMVT